MILRTLRNTEQSIGSYVWKASLISVLPSLVVSFLVMTLFANTEPGPTFRGPKLLVIMSVLGLSPWLETLLMWPVLSLLKRFVKGAIPLAATSAVIWGILHSLASPLWGIVVAWPFFVFSICFLEWQRKSTGSAILATGLTHTCQNLLPALALAVSA